MWQTVTEYKEIFADLAEQIKRFNEDVLLNWFQGEARSELEPILENVQLDLEELSLLAGSFVGKFPKLVLPTARASLRMTVDARKHLEHFGHSDDTHLFRYIENILQEYIGKLEELEQGRSGGQPLPDH